MCGAQPLLPGSRVLVVDGAGVGNGRGIAFGVAAAGARVAVADRDREVTRKITERGGKAYPARHPAERRRLVPR
jgi:NAD(P)-dependent dehydrogenase (short-subunit alcohol dehydrogenase family)